MYSVAQRSSDLIYKTFHHGRSRSAEAKHRLALSHGRESARIVSERPPSRPSTRKDLSQTSLSVYPQSQSLFFKLPPEIRQYVYKLVLGSHAFFVTHDYNRLVNQTYSVPESAEDYFGTFPIRLSPWDSARLNRYGERVQVAHQSSCVSRSLFLTCHAIYAESISILYDSNIFAMSTPLDLVYLHDYTILPQRFAGIRHLQLQWAIFGGPNGEDKCIGRAYKYATWMNFWALTAEMELRSLGLYLMIFGCEEECTTNAKWLRPLLKLKGIQNVGLMIHGEVGVCTVIPLEGLMREIEEQWTNG